MASIYDAAVPALSKNGLSYDFDIKQEVIEGNMKITVACIVTHAGGHSKRVEMFGPPEAGGNKPIHKAIASAVTIFSRLTLKAALGLAERKDPSDDDGAAADEAATQVSGPASPSKISAEQIAEIEALAADAQMTEEAWAAKTEVPSFKDILVKDFPEAKKRLESRRDFLRKQARK
jgi:hypothetical protein